MTCRVSVRPWCGFVSVLFVLAAHAAHAQTAALDAELRARSADALAAEPLRALAGLHRAARLLDLHATAPDARDALLSRVSQSGRSALARDHARWLRAQRLLQAGDIEGARSLQRSLGVVESALLIGPFPNTGGTAFGTPSAADDVVTTLRDGAAGVERTVRWHEVQLDPRGLFDVGAQLSAVRETRTFLAFVVEARAETPAALRIGSSGPVRVVVNGTEVGRDDAQRDHALDQTSVGVRFLRGANLVIVEAGFLGPSGHVTVRLTRPDGAPIAGLQLRATAEDVRRAADRRVPTGARAPVVVVDPFADDGAPATQRMLIDLEVALGAADQRDRPVRLREWLEQSARAPARSAQERSSLLARLAIEWRGDDLTRARELHEQALALDPDNITALLELADIRDEQGRTHDARAALERAVRAAPSSDIAVHQRLEFSRRHDEAGIAAEEALLARARRAPTRRNLSAAADVLDERGDRLAALALSRLAADAAWGARLEEEHARALLAEDPTRIEDVVRAQRTQLALRPGNHELAERLALVLESAGRSPEADALVDERARGWPHRAEPDATRAVLSLVRADRDGARAALAAALDKQPQDADLARTRRALEAEDELVARYGVDPAALQRLPIAPDAERPGAEVLAHTVAIRLFDNGLARIITDRAIRVLDVEKARSLQRLSFDFSDGRETLDVLVAEKIAASGRREPARRIWLSQNDGKVGGVYTDAAARVVDMPPLEKGDVLFIRTRKELVGRQNLFGDFFGVLEPIQGVLPVHRWRVVVETSRKAPVVWGGRNAPTPKTQDGGDGRVLDFVREDVPAIIPEPGMPPFLEHADYLSLSTYSSWEDMGRWYEALAAPALALDDELRAIARRERAAAASDADLVRRLYEWVVTSTRYVGIELGIHGWKPYPVVEVFRRRYGDCKDKASLLVALLREAGVPANLALVRTANLGLLSDAPASMWNFNHAIAYVPSLDLFLDGTAEQSGWRELPTLDQGAQSLIVGAHGAHPASRLVTIPVVPSDGNLNVSDYVLRLDPSGALAVVGRERFRGHGMAEQRRDFADPATRRDVLQGHLARIMPGTAVHGITMTDLALGAAELGYDFTATLPARAVRDTSDAMTMPVSLYPHDLAGSYADRSKRTHDLFVDHPWRTRNVMRYVLPAGYEVRDLPAGGTVTSPHLRFVQRIERTADGFIVDEDAALLSRRIPAADYPAFRRDALAADALMKRKIRIVRSASDPS